MTAQNLMWQPATYAPFFLCLRVYISITTGTLERPGCIPTLERGNDPHPGEKRSSWREVCLGTLSGLLHFVRNLGSDQAIYLIIQHLNPNNTCFQRLKVPFQGRNGHCKQPLALSVRNDH